MEIRNIFLDIAKAFNNGDSKYLLDIVKAFNNGDSQYLLRYS